ncbi:Histidine triad nucleotide-binding protein 1-like [Oopsacas minuta]|uniref:Histidine triad nucleotide-binding protein 1-like n=1 Tax=Oopsacas minuta TaxID=111878 RepID=A0AAV7KI13_9METZ|nr:Histidine triad nucleotide-binding protein 1-like [Oopsacas minuta]
MADTTEKNTATPDDTIFGKIIRGEIKTEFLYKDDKCVAFKDINPVAPIHILIVPIKFITQISEAKEEDEKLLGHLLLVAKKVAEDQKLDKGYRLVINNGKEGQQSVYHLHIHLIGGKQLSWPPC